MRALGTQGHEECPRTRSVVVNKTLSKEEKRTKQAKHGNYITSVAETG